MNRTTLHVFLLAAFASSVLASAAYANPCLEPPVSDQSLLIDGDFETGDFTGWTLAAFSSQVCDAAVIGGEARFQESGCELIQSVGLLAGDLDICAEIAAVGGFGSSTIDLLFDGQIVDSVSLGGLRELSLDSLSASLLDITPGTHEIRIRVGHRRCPPGVSCDFFCGNNNPSVCECERIPLPPCPPRTPFVGNVTVVLSPFALDVAIAIKPGTPVLMTAYSPCARRSSSSWRWLG